MLYDWIESATKIGFMESTLTSSVHSILRFGHKKFVLVSQVVRLLGILVDSLSHKTILY